MSVKEINNLQVIKNRVLKITRRAIIFIFLFLFLLFGSLFLPPVQTYLGQKAANYFTQKTGYKTTIEKIHIKWFDDAVIKGLRVKDLHGKDFIYLEEAEIDYTISSLRGHNVVIDEIYLYKPVVHLYF